MAGELTVRCHRHNSGNALAMTTDPLSTLIDHQDVQATYGGAHLTHMQLFQECSVYCSANQEFEAQPPVVIKPIQSGFTPF